MMCSSATSFHALKVARLQPGETVAVFGAGGLGLSAIQLARAEGAAQVFAIDVSAEKLELARELGAVPLNAREKDPVRQIFERTNNRGVNVSLELIGLPATMRQSLQCLAVQGRAAIAGLSQKTFEVAPYTELINKEAELLGVSDHLAAELPALLDYARTGKLDLSRIITRRLPLEAGAINEVLDALQSFKQKGRAVIVPE